MKSKTVPKFKETEIGKIPIDWKLGYFSTDLKIKGRIGWKGYKTSDLRTNGPIVMGGENISSSIFLDLRVVKHLSREKFEESPEIMLKKNDLLLVTRGNGIGKIGFFNGSIREATINPTLIIISKFEGNPKFLFYYLLSKKGQDNLLSIASGSSIPAIYQGSLKKIQYPKPSKQTQEKIANVLYCLDEKIQNLQNQNKILEQIVQAIFKSWFVDFDGITEFKDSELGKIPKGWTNDVLENITNITSGKRPMFVSQSLSSETNIPIYGGGGIMGYVHDALFSNPLIITGRVGTIGKIFRITDPCWLSDNTLVILPKHQYFFEFIFLLMNKIDYFTFNRGSSQPLITQTDLKNIKIILPDNKSLKKFHENTFVMFSLIDNNINKIHNLSKLRDTLLPKLMSGEIQI